jgi:hypothetical protein
MLLFAREFSNEEEINIKCVLLFLISYRHFSKVSLNIFALMRNFLTNYSPFRSDFLISGKSQRLNNPLGWGLLAAKTIFRNSAERKKVKEA